eukprot:13575766-Alexandrium_andersonii.AAC.1
MGEAAALNRPAGRNALILRSKLAEIGDPFSCSSGRRGRRAKHGASGARCRNLGDADCRQFRVRDADVSPCGPAGDRSLFRME